MGKVKKKPYIRYVILGILATLMVGCIIRIAMPDREWNYTGSYTFAEGESYTEEPVFEHISLGTGVYRVELSYECTGDAIAVCNVKDGTVYKGGLLCNGEHLYSALGHTSYDFWLYEPTEELTVTIDYSGQEKLTTGNLRIVETNLLWTRYLVILAAAALLVLATMWLERREAVKGRNEQRRQILFGIGVIAFFASIPYFYDGMVSGADLTYHLHRIEGVKDGLLTGQFPVRLEPRWVFDHGYANGIFYCNLLLYFPALLRMAGFTMTESYAFYCIGLNIATAAIAWYCFNGIFGDRIIGLVCSALYTLSIFRFFKLVMVGAVGEGSAYTFLPLVVYGIYLVFEKDVKDREFHKSWIILGLGYAGLIQTHVLTCEITALFTVLFCLIYIRRVFTWPRFRQLACGAFFALGLSLWYLVPFVDYYLTQDVRIRHASARTIQDRGTILAQILQQFWFSRIPESMEGKAGDLLNPIGVGLFLVIGMMIFWLLLFFGDLQKQKEAEKSFAIKAAGFGCLALWMSTNSFPWDNIQKISGIAATLVSSLQFPNRFLGWGTVLLVTVTGYVIRYFQNNRKIFYQMSLITAAVSLSASYLFMMDSGVQKRDVTLYNQESMGFGYISGEEYLIYGTDSTKLTFARPEANENIQIEDYEKSGLNISFFCRNDSTREEIVTLPVLMYKGYAAGDDKGEALEITDDGRHILQVCIPGGYAGTVRVRFVEPWYWRTAELVTLITVAGIVFFGIRKRRQR